MYIPKAGDRIRVVNADDTRGYQVGHVYTVTMVDTDQTLKAADAQGTVGNWLKFSQIVPASYVSFEWLTKDWPAEIRQLLAAFDGFSHQPIRQEVKDRMLSDLSPVEQHEYILRASTTEE